MEQQHVAIAPASSSRKSGICLIQQGCEDSRGSWPPWWRDAASRALQEDRDRGPQTCPSTCTGLSLENKQIWKFKILLLHKWTLINQWSSSTVLWYLYLNFQTGKVSQSVQSVSHVQPFATPWIAARLPVHHQLLEFTQTHVHRVGDAIQPSHPLSSPSPPAPNPSQHQGLFKWVRSSNEVAKVLELQL